MLSTLKKLPTSSTYLENIPILLVSPHPADLSALREILHHADWNIHRCGGVQEAIRHLDSHVCSVVLCERDLPDGSWQDVLTHAKTLMNCPMLLVVSRQADDSLWAEVLNLGGYDVLLKPFDKSEVARVIGMAWRHWWGACHGLAAKPNSAQFLQTA